MLHGRPAVLDATASEPKHRGNDGQEDDGKDEHVQQDTLFQRVGHPVFSVSRSLLTKNFTFFMITLQLFYFLIFVLDVSYKPINRH